MKSVILLLSLCLFCVQSVNANVFNANELKSEYPKSNIFLNNQNPLNIDAWTSVYTFSTTAGTYTTLTTPTVIWTGTAINNAAPSAVTMPSFVFNGTTYTTAYVSSNGFITLGSAPTASNNLPISSAETYSGAISGFGVYAINFSTTATVSYQNVTATNEFVIQWTDIRRSTPSGDRLSMQIRLNYSTNAINIVYGGTIVGANSTSTPFPQVGLRAAANTDYNNRTVGNDGNWTSSTAGTSNTATCRWVGDGSVTLPAVGRTYTWTPPVPSTLYYDIQGTNVDLSILTNWTSKADGSAGGTAPANFTTGNVNYIIKNGTTPSIGAALTVSGTLSKIIVGDGSAAEDFTIPSGFTLTGTIDIQSNSTLHIANTTIPTLGTLGTSSTVDFSGTGTQTIPANSYGNLTSSSTGARTISSTLNIAGTFTPGANTYTVTGSTINFNGTGSQSIPVFNYNSLTSSSTGARTLPNVGTIGVAGTFTPGTNAYTITGSTISFRSTGTQTIPAFNYYNLTGNGSTGARTLAATGTVGVAGTFTTGTNTYTVTGSTVSFNGTSSQTIPAITSAYNNLTINNTAGISPGAGINVNGIFTLTSGKLALGNYDLVLGTAGTTAGTFNSSNMVIADIAAGTGQLKKTFPTGASAIFTYPVGDNTGNYTPAQFTFSANSTQRILGVSVKGTSALHGSVPADYLNRYWSVTNSSAINSFTCAANFTFVPAEVTGNFANCEPKIWNGTDWLIPGGTITSSNISVPSFSEVNSVGNYEVTCFGISAPNVPTLLSPANGTIDLSVTPTLDWNDVPSAVSYRVQVSTNASFSIILYDTNALTSSQITVPSGLLNTNTQYFWRVCASNTAGTSAYSGVWDFTTAPNAPNVPVLSSPANNSVNMPTTLSFKWLKAIETIVNNKQTNNKQRTTDNGQLSTNNGPLAISSYSFEYTTDSTFATGVTADTLVGDTTKILAGLNNSTKYFWRVKAKNQTGWSAYSSVWSFTTVIASPGAPVLISPLNNSTGEPLSLNLVWSKTLTTTHYHLQLSTDPAFGSFVINDTTLIDTTKALNGLNNLTNYYWRVRSYNLSGWSAFSNARTFRTIGTASQVVLSAPSNDAVNLPLAFSFNWFKSFDLTNRSTNNGQLTTINSVLAVSKYWFEYGTDSTFALVLGRDSSLIDTVKALSGLNYITKYYWRVKAKNQIGWGTFSETWNFTTAPNVPNVPTLLTPANNSVDLTIIPALDWNDVLYAASYRLQVSVNSGFSSTVYDTAGLTVSQINVPFGKLTTNTQYFWRVNATNFAGTSSYSAVWSFTTAPNIPNMPYLSFPANNATGQPVSLTFKWFKAIETLDNAQLTTNNGQLTTIDGPLSISKYWFEYGTDSTFTTATTRDSSLIDTTKTLAGLNNLTKYFWRVRAKNQTGWGGFSSVWNFTTIISVPSAPSLSSPANNSTGISFTPSLVWNTVNTATSYRIQVSTDNTFATTLLDTAGVTGTTVTVPSGRLTGFTQYYWRVNASNAGGSGSWSTVRNFRTLQNLTLNLKVYLEGFWNGTTHIADTVKVYLANSTTPYAIVDSAKVILSTAGTSAVNFTKAPNGSYYVILNHRNHLETWSKLAQTFVTNSAVNYDFTTAITQAYGDNMKQVGSVWVLLGGDANADGSIDATDIGIFTGQFGSLGYLSCDFNGDGDVNALDVSIISGNFGLIKIIPGVEPLAPETIKNKKAMFQSTLKSDKDVQKQVNKSKTEVENKNKKHNK